jgi:hypothetical protein
MRIEIPNDWMGKPIEGSLERIMKAKTQTAAPIEPQKRIVVPANINPREYLQVPPYNLIIAKSEIHKGKDMYQALEALAEENLFMPSPAEFMRHWMNVKNAAVDKTNVLVYADDTKVPDAETLDLWKYMSSSHRDGCWTWLNALFKVDNNNNWSIDQNLNVITGADGKKVLQGTSQPLDCPIREDCYVDLEFNTQGFPIRKSAEQKYKQGDNIYFWHPRDNAVAGFVASSDGAGLNCNGVPSSRWPSLGVRQARAKN